MKKTLLAICLTVASLSLSAQELLDFSQPDPVSATPVRTTKLFRYTMNARMDFSPVFVSPEGGFEISPSLMLGFELRPWRNRHYFSFGVATEYVNSQVFKAHYAIAGDNLSFNEAESGSIGLDRFGYGFPLTYGIDINQRKSLEFTVMPHYWNNLKLTNTYGAGEQSDYLHAQGLNQKDGVSTIGTYYTGFNPFTVDFSVAYYPTANIGIGLKYAPSMLFKKGSGPSYSTVSWSFIFRF